MLYSNKINIDKISVSLIEEILDIDEIEPALSFKKEDVSEKKQIGLTIHSKSDEIFAVLDELEIPYHKKTIEEVLNFLFDRLLYEYMEDQSYYDEESYNKFKNTFMYKQIQMLIYHVKTLLLWICNNDIKLMSLNCKILYRKNEINPIDETNYLEKYEHYKLFMEFLPPEKLPRYFNQLVGLKHFSVKTKAIYHALVEELEIRDIDYDSMLYGNERMLSYKIEITSINNKYKVIRQC